MAVAREMNPVTEAPPPPGGATLRAEQLSLNYVTSRATTHAVREVSLQLEGGTFAGIVGPSGSGKTSLLYLLSGLKTASSGKVFIGDLDYGGAASRQQLDFRRRYFGFIFQQPFLVSYLNVLENVLVPIENPAEHDRDRAMDLLEALDIDDLAPKFPNECSGGERVRVAMARGLVHRPHFLFVDEPTASLDLATGARVMEVLAGERAHGTLLVVTHDMDILREANVVLRMRDGALVETVQPSARTTTA